MHVLTLLTFLPIFSKLLPQLLHLFQLLHYTLPLFYALSLGLSVLTIFRVFKFLCCIFFPRALTACVRAETAFLKVPLIDLWPLTDNLVCT